MAHVPRDPTGAASDDDRPRTPQATSPVTGAGLELRRQAAAGSDPGLFAEWDPRIDWDGCAAMDAVLAWAARHDRGRAPVRPGRPACEGVLAALVAVGGGVPVSVLERFADAGWHAEQVARFRWSGRLDRAEALLRAGACPPPPLDQHPGELASLDDAMRLADHTGLGDENAAGWARTVAGPVAWASGVRLIRDWWERMVARGIKSRVPPLGYMGSRSDPSWPYGRYASAGEEAREEAVAAVLGWVDAVGPDGWPWAAAGFTVKQARVLRALPEGDPARPETDQLLVMAALRHR